MYRGYASLRYTVGMYVIVPLILFLCTSFASAHSSGASFEMIEGQYLIDIGYDPVTIVERDRVVLDMELWEASSKDASSRTSVPFTRVWLRLEHEGKTVMATGVGKPSFGPTTYLFTAYAPGAWTLHVRYEDNDDVIVDTAFPFTVEEEQQRPLFILIVGGVVILGALGATVWWYRRRHS